MACGTPVIGACSGGPKDFITTGVGELCPEPGSYSTADCKALGASIDATVTRVLVEDWNTAKRSTQVTTLLKGIARVSTL
jgi:glycosyltransferase involved in cell wall biosynthesis